MRGPPPGTPKTPSSGRKKGTPNTRPLDGEAYARAIVEDPEGLEKLCESFRDGTMHPQVLIHMLLMTYGTPKELTDYAIAVARNGHSPGPDTAHQTTIYRLSPISPVA